ncbi:MAG: type 4a pilus biogenesis protein PilO [Patescibacteria group bacterium]|nr:type 4a pilus biogenesis protein PilO [Patescibacteria group bacterium]MDD5567211.1 type 4a pilus biogenesis protein PilO [Patescibacteria group bacterium]
MAIGSQLRKTFLYLVFKNHKAISVLLVVIVFGVGGFSFLYPKYQSIQNQGLLDFGNKQKQLDERQTYLAKLEKMVETFDSINSKDVEALKELLPSSQEIPELFVMVDQFGQDLGLKVTRIAITDQGSAVSSGSETAAETTEKKSILQSIAATANPNEQVGITESVKPAVIGSLGLVIGLETKDISYSKYKELLKAIEENIRIFDLNSVDYDPGTDSLTLNITTYYLI